MFYLPPDISKGKYKKKKNVFKFLTFYNTVL